MSLLPLIRSLFIRIVVGTILVAGGCLLIWPDAKGSIFAGCFLFCMSLFPGLFLTKLAETQEAESQAMMLLAALSFRLIFVVLGLVLLPEVRTLEFFPFCTSTCSFYMYYIAVEISAHCGFSLTKH